MEILPLFRRMCVVIFLCFICHVMSAPPHIIFIVVDDLGWNDVSFHGSKQIPTPNIDALATNGIILNNYYVQPICTPSRGTLMTGKYPIRLGLQHDVIYAGAPWGLSPDEKILPQYLKERGYTTRGVGKWHLGFHRKSYLPVNRGFDSFFGYWTGKEDFYSHFEEGIGMNGLDFHDNNENVWNYTNQYGTAIFSQKAEDIIRRHDVSKPLFLYLAHQAVHAGNSYTPLQAPPEYVDRFKHIKDEDRRIFAGMTSALDDSIGELISVLNETGMLTNSIVVFTTDNGAAVKGIDASTGSNWPLRGSKYNMWEGGVRGVAFIWSLLLVKSKGKISSDMMHMSDWLPTLYAAIGGDLKTLKNIDGHNLWPTFCSNEPSPRNEVLLNIDPRWKVECVRKGKYKLLKGSVFNGDFDGWFDKEGKNISNTPFTASEIVLQNQVYASLAAQSQVIPILSNLYETFSIFSNEENSSDQCYEENTNSCSASGESSFRSALLQQKNLVSLEIMCGNKSFEDFNKCEPLKASCLFDIESDPCEYNNLASTLPKKVEELEELLDSYRSQSVPIRNKPIEPSSNPKYYGYAWIPWQEAYTVNYN